MKISRAYYVLNTCERDRGGGGASFGLKNLLQRRCGDGAGRAEGACLRVDELGGGSFILTRRTREEWHGGGPKALGVCGRVVGAGLHVGDDGLEPAVPRGAVAERVLEQQRHAPAPARDHLNARGARTRAHVMRMDAHTVRLSPAPHGTRALARPHNQPARHARPRKHA